MKDVMRLTRNTRIPEEPAFAQQWNDLVRAMEQPQVFYTYEWSLAVSRAYPVPSPLIFCAYRDETLVGIASLAADQARKEACFLAESTADYCDFVSAPADRGELITLVLLELRAMGIRDLRLANLPADSGSTHSLRSSARSSGYATFSRPAYVCAQVQLQSPEQRQEVIRSTQRSTKKAKNTSARLGGIRVDHAQTCDELMAEFPEFAAANVARFLGQGRISHMLGRDRQAFVLELAKLLSARGWLAVSSLKLDDRTVAWHFGFKFAGTRFWYLPAFDTEVRNLHPGPGSYLLYQFLQRAAQEPETQVVDLGLGDEGYKKQYAKYGRRTLYVVASRSWTRLAREMCRYRAAELIKSSPRAEAYVRNCVSRLASLRARVTQDRPWGVLLSCCRRLYNCIAQEVTVSFLEGTGQCQGGAGANLQLAPLSLRLLGRASIRYQHEGDTLPYMMRSALRLRSPENQGFALLDEEGIPVHICWVSPCEGFRLPELDEPLREPAPGSVLLFDAWTAVPRRQPACEAEFAAAIAAHVLQNGNKPWVFRRGREWRPYEDSGFVPRFAIVRTTRLFYSKTSTVEFGTQPPEGIMGLYPAA